MTASTILVVGATGTVGRHLVQNLREEGARVRAGTRDPGAAAVDGAVRLDLLDPSTFEPALDGVDTVFQLAPPGHPDAHGLLWPFTQRAAKHAKKIVTMTAQGVEASEEIPFRKLELAVEGTGVAFAHLRPTWFADNFHTFWLSPIQQAGVIPLPAADARTAFVDARDIASAAAALLTRAAFDGQAWELTGPEALTYADAAGVLSEVTGKSIRYQPIDDESFEKNLVTAGMPKAYAGLLTGLFGMVRTGRAAAVTATMKTLTGSTPRSLRTYAQDHRAAFV